MTRDEHKVKQEEREWMVEYVSAYRHHDSDVPEHSQKCISILFRLWIEGREEKIEMCQALRKCETEIDKNIDDDLPFDEPHCKRMNAHLKANNPARVALEKYARMGDEHGHA